MNKDNLVAIETQFGTVYIENIYTDDQEEMDRFKLYDSDGKYMDYYNTDFFHRLKISFETWERGASEAETFLTLIEVWLLLDYDRFSQDLKDFSEYGKTEEEIRDNEWINRIGKYYVLMNE